MRCSRRWYWGVSSAVRRRPLSRNRLDTSLIISVITGVKCGGNVLDGIRGVCLVVGRRSIRCVVALIVQCGLTSLCGELLDELVLPTCEEKLLIKVHPFQVHIMDRYPEYVVESFCE